MSNAQVAYMCEEIARALELPVQSPAGTVQSVRELAAYAEGLKRRVKRHEAAKVSDAPRTFADVYPDSAWGVAGELLPWKDRVGPLPEPPDDEDGAEVCCALSPDLWVCTRATHADGLHVATSSTAIYAIWEDASTGKNAREAACASRSRAGRTGRIARRKSG